MGGYLLVIGNHYRPIFAHGESVGLAVISHALRDLLSRVHFQDAAVWNIRDVDVTIFRVYGTL